ncbi:MAG: alpha/beta hydrolase [Gammaproteobacteria bacterium]|nr:alpha/beta hydrolase [Gammaproteobacteria bacterium]
MKYPMPIANAGRRSAGAWLLVLLCATAALLQPALAATPLQDPAAPSTVNGLTATLSTVQGLPVRYYEAGEGEALILLHGGRLTVFNSANMWARNVTGLAEDFHVYALDRYGYGMTGADADDNFTYEREVKFLLDFIDAQQLRKVNLVGNSSGAAVALLFSLAHPERVATLTLIAVGPHTPASLSKGLIMREACNNIADAQASWSCWMQAMTYRSDTTFDSAFFAASEYMQSLPAWRAIEARKLNAVPQAGDDYWDPYLARIRAEGVPALPIMLVCGQHDNLDWEAGDRTPQMKGCLHLFDALGANNDKVKLVAYNQAGHFPYRELAEQFNGDLAHFIHYWNSR